ncbi:MAG: RsmD family RNA methyltransferase [Actinomycetes bacterium]
MTRVVAGSARGVRLKVPDVGTRPTSDRAREAIFSSVESMRGPWVHAEVLDLYAGSGACGLEAASRGAARVDLVESDRKAVKVIERNREVVMASGVPAVVEIHAAKVEQWVRSRSTQNKYDEVFCDPPYTAGAEDVAAVLSALAATGSLAVDGLVVLERSARDAAWQWQQPFDGQWHRRYGEAHLWIAALGSVPRSQ